MMLGVMTLSYPLIDFIYGGGEFSASDTALTARAMFFTSLGMVGYALQNILCRVYYAKQDGRTPLVAGMISIAVNILCCELLIGPMGLAGLGLASAISSTVYAAALAIPLQRSGSRFITKKFCADMLKTAAGACVMAVIVHFCAELSEGILPGMAGKLLTLIFPTAAGVIVFFAAAALLKMDELVYIKDIFKKVVKRG